jgi:hypothetical protein
MEFKESILFILRRTIWSGRATRADLMEAFPISEATASRAMKRACLRWPGVLVRKPKHVEAFLQVVPPPEASASRMLELLEQTPFSFAQTGLKVPDELRIAGFKIRQANPFDPQVAGTLIHATIRGVQLDLMYVGLRYGEAARWRSVMPLSFDTFQGQWRLHAHDLESAGFPVKSFVVSRMLDAQVSMNKKPKGLRLELGEIPVRRYRAKLNPRMTADQRLVIGRELGLNAKGEALISDSAFFYFKKTYMESHLEGEESIVWPLVVELERMT